MEALDIAVQNKKTPFDIVITDLQMEDAFDGEPDAMWNID